MIPDFGASKQTMYLFNLFGCLIDELQKGQEEIPRSAQ